MKRFGWIMIAAAFVFSSGFFKKGEDGKYSIDKVTMEAAEKKANEVAEQASAETEKYKEQITTVSKDMIETIKTAAAKYNVTESEVVADLGMNTDELKAKVAAMEPAKLVAYLGKYKDVFAGTQQKVADCSAQVKDLKWTQKVGKKGKELKASLAKYNDQFSGLKTQATVYAEKLKSYGLDLSAYGLDLSAFGL